MKNHRLKGIASEMLFAARWYELVEDESLALISPLLTLDGILWSHLLVLEYK